MLLRIYKIESQEQLVGVPVPGAIKTDLVFDTDTRIVYYKFEENFSNFKINDKNLGFMSPYLGSHGRACRFINCEIVEIHKD